MKKIVAFALLSLVLGTACQNREKKKEPSATEVTEVSIPDLLAQADQYVGSTVKITGMVQHVCKETGKRMFLIDRTPENRIRIDVNENMGTFPVELEGSTVEVIGEMKELRIDETYLRQWEEEIKSGEKLAEDKKIHTGAESAGSHDESSQLSEAADQGTHTAAEEQIARYREQLAQSGSDHLSFYSVTCVEYREIEE